MTRLEALRAQPDITFTDGALTLAYIARMAPIWRARKPSGRYILNRLPRDRACPMHGWVTKHHFCPVDCAVSGFKCLPGCSKAECDRPGVAG